MGVGAEKKSKMRSGDGDEQRAGWRWPWGSGKETMEESRLEPTR